MSGSHFFSRQVILPSPLGEALHVQLVHASSIHTSLAYLTVLSGIVQVVHSVWGLQAPPIRT